MSGIQNEENGIVERIDPLNVPAGIFSIHLVRYEFAARWCTGMSTLDIACGAGYGSSYLADFAASVVAGDADGGAIEFARRNYSAHNLSFKIMDALEMPFSDASFECVVSFETIEHLPDIDKFLSEVSRVLTPDGCFIVSTPLVPVTTHRPANPHHTVEFSLHDFRALLSGHFATVRMYGQSRVQTEAHRWLQRLDVLGIRHRIPSFLRKRATRALGTVPYEEMGTGNQQILLEEFARAHDMIAVCTRAVRDG
jgi:2-polyprenyl-3-methyl-5-hydroxy-6-metoxy-1,4-benzoquinol methylase